MYYVFEGIDGSGKDTQADLLTKYLKTWHGKKPLRLNEPDSNSDIGSLLRNSLKYQTHEKCHAALFLADRLATQYETIIPALESKENTDIVCVRSLLSTFVYQQEHWQLKDLMAMHNILPCKIDVLFILDVDPAEGLKRVNNRSNTTEIYEKLDVLSRARQRYLDLAVDKRMKKFISKHGKIVVLKTTGKDVSQVHGDVLSHVLAEFSDDNRLTDSQLRYREFLDSSFCATGGKFMDWLKNKSFKY